MRRMEAGLGDALLSVRWQGLNRLMAAEIGQHAVRADVQQLMDEGTAALEAGETRRAHDLFRKAAAADPYDARVWQALLGVVETGEDRRVCLENIVALNPLNADARRQLRADEDSRRLARQQAADHARARTLQRAADLRAFRRSLLLGLTAGVVGTILGVLASIILYGAGGL